MITLIIKTKEYIDQHSITKMAQTYLVLALIIQSAVVFANDLEIVEEPVPTRDVLQQPELIEDDQVVKDASQAHVDFMDFLKTNKLYPSTSVAMMTQATENMSNKTVEEQLKDIKTMAKTIMNMIENEFINVLEYAASCDKGKEVIVEAPGEVNQLRRKRETPMDSTKMVARLLKHIKSNNEYQNIAIEKMMTAQEIANKYGIEFNPDPEILTDLAVAATEQAKELTSMLSDACDSKNATTSHVEFIPFDMESSPVENDTYYVYTVHQPEEMFTQLPSYEYMPEPIQRPMHHHHTETQVLPPPHHHHHHQPPTTPKPTFYETLVPEYYQPYCSVEPAVPMTTTTTIFMPFEEIVEPEPELVGEEYEEVVSSKVLVDHEEPGMSTVNHVMTYTLSEKSHFKKPEIQQLPQQMQYSFFLI